MKKVRILVLVVSLLVPGFFYLAYAQMPPAPEVVLVPQMEIKTVDVNHDGKPDVYYYQDGKYIGKVEVDTNNDGNPDIKIATKDGKFDFAEVDTDYNGTMDKKFTDQKEFNQWVNQNKPDYDKELNKQEWIFPLAEF